MEIRFEGGFLLWKIMQQFISMLNRTISIVILDHEIDILKEFEGFDVKWQIRDNKTGKKVL